MWVIILATGCNSICTYILKCIVKIIRNLHWNGILTHGNQQPLSEQRVAPTIDKFNYSTRFDGLSDLDLVCPIKGPLYHIYTLFCPYVYVYVLLMSRGENFSTISTQSVVKVRQFYFFGNILPELVDGNSCIAIKLNVRFYFVDNSYPSSWLKRSDSMVKNCSRATKGMQFPNQNLILTMLCCWNIFLKISWQEKMCAEIQRARLPNVTKSSILL